MNNPTLGSLCTSRMSRADSDVPNRGVNVYSCPRQVGYPRGNLSDRRGPHQQGHPGSLGHAFTPALLAFRSTVNPTFVLIPLQRISDPLESDIGHLCFFIEGVPPQPNYPPAVVPLRVRRIRIVEWCYNGASTAPERTISNGSHLRSATSPIHQLQAVVKLHGVFFSHWESSAYSLRSEFTGSLLETAGPSLRHSCKPPIKRRGITLP